MRDFEAFTIRLEGFRHRFYRAGAPEGRPIVGLHGFGASGRLYRMTAPYWAEAGYTLYALDLLGFGESERPRNICYSLPLYVSLLCAFQEALGIERAPLVAHSLSGKIGLAQALWHPQRLSHLILVAPAGWHPAEKLPLLAHVPGLGTVFRSFFSHPVMAHLLLRLLLPDADPEQRRSHRDTLAALVRSSRWMDLDRWGLRRNLSDRLKTPVTLLWGASDRLLPLRWASRIRKRLPRARVIVVPEAGHLPMREQPEAFVGAVLGAIKLEGEGYVTTQQEPHRGPI
ncbi:MAG: alpha/beta hydrolase [Bacteroidetes bacterium]|nr:alpha/beta hydrolase [Rhodothermia bacterium]MCS7154186.1 alpha/beta hydrolase [Bacteroidota bacterium]MCX7906778.1 alpha/beta hydrolase [Bacteroidota bacterium]MDW8136942.1 alpha/beta hydrolase [Bacteroidota bacterium]MDW8285187.1 alpha/beta hydrolase [Bacteroidota bacterium]